MKNEKYINPFTDYGFKKLFGEEPNKELLLDFLNELLHKEQGTIVDLTYIKSEKLGFTEIDRKAIFDLYCENDKGEKFIVELQKTKQKFFKDRTLYYSTFPIREQSILGDWDFELKAVYTNLEMPKFNKTIDELETRFDKWMFTIKNLNKLDRIPETLKEKIFEKLFDIAEIAKFSPEQLFEYENSLKYYRDLKNSIDTARMEGIEEGIEKGIAKGVEKEKIQTIINGLKEGISKELLSKLTGYSIDQINLIEKSESN